MFGITGPEEMTPGERAREVAGILAQGFLRLRGKGAFLGDSAAKADGKKPVTGNISNSCGADKSAS